ncbi:sulfotransferase family 2 domain-containing protein [Sediminicoccus sp. KRV36]|uniref:sulfotransferase family 2 domain-containing protein n=1 Tax=Sediminicoccus sp. KRV36 TaxID=3133721 RepID=UPI002010261D|nr:sulfotransferase family 2 domain-containing protein [Sediminicoccus rosea]UPY37452.1 sulfotransferase family 2 domain-containing protein [Sediminicoccus rosea]
MPVSPNGETSQPRLVFLHVPRSGGTTLHEAFAAKFTDSEICRERMNRLERVGSAELGTYHLFSGHYRFEHLALIPPPRLAVTVLREPRARLFSLYHHWRRHWADLAREDRGLRHAQQLDLIDFLRSPDIAVVEAFDNAMARQLAGDSRARAPGTYTRWAWADQRPLAEAEIVAAACRNLMALDAIGFTRSLDALHGFVCRRMGWPLPQPLPRRNAMMEAAWGVHPAKPERLSDEVVEALNHLTRLDRQVWDFARIQAGAEGLFRPTAPPAPAWPR